MYPFLAKRVTYPLGDLALGTSVVHYHAQLMESQWWSLAQLRAQQDRKLRKLISHAYRNVPYYGRLFAQLGMTDRDVENVDDLRKLPILTKSDVRTHFAELLSVDHKKWNPILSHTGGSTGEPLGFYITKDAASVNWAGMFRGWSWGGYRIGEKRSTIGGSSMMMVHGLDVGKRLRLLLERNQVISTKDMSERRMSLNVDRLIRYRPRYLYGYASALAMYGEFVLDRGIPGINPVTAFSTAEMLLPDQRKTIRKAFGCDVIDCYGTYDGGAQAFECSAHKGYHISSEKAVMEFLDEGGKPVGPGVAGEIVCTDLHNYAMPLIRYAVGDVGVPDDSTCSCGRGLPLMKSIEGRSLDFVVTPDGNKVRGLRLTDTFDEPPGGHQIAELASIRRFQIVQLELSRLVVRIVQDLPPSEDEIVFVKQSLREALRYPMDIQVEFLDAIEEPEGGKRRFVISKVRYDSLERSHEGQCIPESR